MTEKLDRNWKQEPWVWLLLAIPLTSVIMGVVMLTLAIQSWSGLVIDDYYKHGKHINRVLARDRHAWELGLSAELELDADGKIEIRLDNSATFASVDLIELEMVHATRPGLDRKIDLRRVDTRWFRGRVPIEGQGRWNLYLQTTDWRLTGSLYRPGSGTVSLLPNYFED